MSRAGSAGAAREAGFSLLEALVAAAIIAAMTGAAYEAAAQSARVEREVQDRRQAVLVAQSLLAQAGVSIALAPGTNTGQDGGFAWALEIAPHAGDEPRRTGGAALVAVRATVRRPDERRPLVTLDTLKIAGS